VRRFLLATAAFALALAAPAAARYQPPPVDFAISAPAAAIHAAADGGMTTRVLHPGKRFNVVGITWRGRNTPVVHIRAHVAGGRWSSWQRLGTDESAAQRVSDPVWAGDADAVQLRLSKRVAGLRIHFVNVLGTATAADRTRYGSHRGA
jgi:hypothetical protein